jgi:hypothetical protein
VEGIIKKERQRRGEKKERKRREKERKKEKKEMNYLHAFNASIYTPQGLCNTAFEPTYDLN